MASLDETCSEKSNGFFLRLIEIIVCELFVHPLDHILVSACLEITKVNGPAQGELKICFFFAKLWSNKIK
jgi:hypothetical protein